MLDKSIERIMREAFPPELPYGFAERVARTAMASQDAVSLWDLMLNLTPRAGIAIGAVTTILLVLSFVGDGPGIIDTVTQYNSLSSLIPIP